MQWNRLKGTTFQLTDQDTVVGTFIPQKGMARCRILDEDFLIYRKGFMHHIIAMTNMNGQNILTTQMLISLKNKYKISYGKDNVFNLEFENEPTLSYKITDEGKKDFLSYQYDPSSELNLKIQTGNSGKNKKLYEFAFFLWYLMMPVIFENQLKFSN